MSEQLEKAIVALNAAPKVNIKGKQYSQVATRVEVFRRHFGIEFGLTTEILDAPDNLVRVRAIISKDSTIVATGLAEEIRGSTNINKTSALENCETSAIGRALAAFGLHGGEYASAGEVQNAIAQQGSGETKSAASEWHGPRNITTLKAEMRAFAGDLHACTDMGMLIGLLSSTQDLQDQCMRDLPGWWYDDEKGAQKTIEAKRDELARAEAKSMLEEAQAG